MYGVTKEQAARFGLPCGGRLQIVLEPLEDTNSLSGLLTRVANRELVARTLDLQTGQVSLAPASRSDTLSFDGKLLTTIHGPRWRLLVIGAGQLSRYLAQMALALDYNVVVCDPREEYADTWDVPGVAFTRGMPDDVVAELNLDSHSAVVAVTHDPKLDDLALIEALKSAAFYVGALGSRLEHRQAQAAAGRVRSVSGRAGSPARPGRLAHRQQDAARDRGVDPGGDDRRAPRRRPRHRRHQGEQGGAARSRKARSASAPTRA